MEIHAREVTSRAPGHVEEKRYNGYRRESESGRALSRLAMNESTAVVIPGFLAFLLGGFSISSHYFDRQKYCYK